MSISANFNIFCDKLKISSRKKAIIELRYCSICKKLNNDFWDINTDHGGVYVGSYGRETANDGINEINMIFEMPSHLLTEYSKMPENGQLLFLEDVRMAISKVYPNTIIQNSDFGIKVCFFDGMCFNIAPVFYKDDVHLYANTEKGGSWKNRDFGKGIRNFGTTDSAVNANLKRLCQMMKTWKEHCNVSITDVLIDTLAHQFLVTWEFKDKSYSYYSEMCKDFFKYLTNDELYEKEWKAIGGFLLIPNTIKFKYKAIIAYHKAEGAINFADEEEYWLAAQKWREIFGQEFPDDIVEANQINDLKDNVHAVYDIHKKCVGMLTLRHYIPIIIQVLSGLSIPIGLLIFEYTNSFYFGFLLFIGATTMFITSLIFRQTNQIRTIIKHRVSMKLAYSVMKQLTELRKDLYSNDIDIVLVRERKKSITSKLDKMYKGTSESISRSYLNAILKLRKFSTLCKTPAVASHSNIRIPEWEKHKFNEEDHIPHLVNYKN